MSDIMTPVPFGNLMNRTLKEHEKGAAFGIRRPFVAGQSENYEIFGRKPETPSGPAAGPHTQLTQNIVAAYVAGSRFLELKTVQKLDGGDLPVVKPCIKADDECYNYEQSTELYVPQTFDEYVKAWLVCKVLAKEYGLGTMDGSQFSVSIGYDLDGTKTEKVDKLIEGMKDVSAIPVFNECRRRLLDHLDRFEKVTKEDVKSISPEVCNCTTPSTLHGCPPQEIEYIARYLIEKKKIHTSIKCNPTLLGYEYARKLMDDMGYDYVTFRDSHFKDDLQHGDAVPMLQRPQALADEKGLGFDVKTINIFPVDVKQSEFPSEKMYTSGKSLYPLSMSVVMRLAKDSGGSLCISYPGDADCFNIEDIVDAGIWPVIMAAIMLKPGGYERLEQTGQISAGKDVAAFEGVDGDKAAASVEVMKNDKHHVKVVEPLPPREIKKPVPLTDCSVAPYREGCPIHQDITRYLQLAGASEFEQALEVILNENPLPFITGIICARNYMNKCTRNSYESSVDIRRTKLEAAEGGFEAVMAKFEKPAVTTDKKAAVVGGGLAGSVAAYFLARGGMKVIVFEKEEKMGNVVRNMIPGFRISDEAIDNDMRIATATGVELVTGKEITSIDELKKEYDYVVLAVGASDKGILGLEVGDTMNALDFLTQSRATDGNVGLGKNAVVIGGGNTAMDIARVAKRNKGAEKASLIYRRARRYIPANEEKLVMAVEGGVEFAELPAPVKLESGNLYCKKTVLGELDANGRRGVVETDEIVTAPVDTMIATVGEKVPGAFYEEYGIVLDSRRCPQVSQGTLETSVKGAYVASDDLLRPAAVVEDTRDGKAAAEAITGKVLTGDLFKQFDADIIYGRKGRLAEENDQIIDSTRCLSRNSYCENCVEVCPNRANTSLVAPGADKHQITHVGYMCNECGNRRSFCPWDSAPYLDRFTPFVNEADMENSKNQSFTVTDAAAGTCKVRLQDKATDYTVGSANEDVPEGIRKIIAAVINDYSYML